MPNAVISRRFSFSAAHKLLNHNGQCANLHGHTYDVEVFISGPIQPVTDVAASSEGMVIDFRYIKDLFYERVRDVCDHRFLNEVVPVKATTAEMLALWMLYELHTAYVGIVGVKVCEQADTTATVEWDESMNDTSFWRKA